MLSEALLNAYIDANILLGVGYLLWSFARFLIVRLGLRRAYITHLKLLNGVMLAIVFCPIAIYFLTAWVAQPTISFSDVVVAQYLEGNVDVTALQLDRILKVREAFERDLVELGSPLSMGLAALFVIGFIGFGFKVLRNALHLYRALNSCRPWRKIGRVQLLLSDSALVPYSTRGIGKHYIVMPTAMLDHSHDVRLAIAHELQHFRQRDVEWAIILEIMTPFFFWNPLFFMWKREVIQLREFSCDQNLIARNGVDVRAYCECLLRASRRSLRGAQNFTIVAPAVPLVKTVPRSVGGLESRIMALTSDRSGWSSRRLFQVTFFPLALAIMAIAVLIQNPADWSHDRLMLSTIINLERLDMHNAETARANFGSR